MKAAVFALVLSLCTFAVHANEAVPTAQDPVAAARAVALAHKLRCLVCQNQSIADSEADLAKDLRRQIDEQIAAGRSDREIIDFMTDRYGDFVLYQPPMKPMTWALWLGPAVLLIVAALAMRNAMRRAAATHPAGQPGGISEAARARARVLLADNDQDRQQ
jgi:cytochrome c-type biogenesis protein CcmH